VKKRFRHGLEGFALGEDEAGRTGDVYSRTLKMAESPLEEKQIDAPIVSVKLSKLFESSWCLQCRDVYTIALEDSLNLVARFSIMLFAIVIVSTNVYARDALTPFTLIREVQLDFEPERVFFLVAPKEGELLHRVPGIYEPFESELGASDRYLVAASIIGSSSEGNPDFAVVVVGAGEQISYFPPEVRKEGGNASVENIFDIHKLREELAAVRLQIIARQKQKLSQEQQIERLRQDETVIARIERVDALKARIELLQLRIDGIENDISHLQKFLELTREQAEPRNFARRERELIRQLKLLADASQMAESGENERRTEARSTMQYQLRLIEASRTLSESGLRERLEQLRARRISLERKQGYSGLDTESPENYLP
jgi:hypothetical protein